MNSIPNILNAYENVKNSCEENLSHLYSAGIPAAAQERLSAELSILKNHSKRTQDLFEIYRLLFLEARRSMQYLTMDGTDASSFILYLLGGTMANPLQPHYYCPNCGHFETVQTRLYGIDLPQKECPACQCNLRADGFSLPISTCFSFNGDRIPNLIGTTTEDFLIFAKRLIQKIYPNNQIVPRGTMALPQKPSHVQVYPSGFYVLPNGTCMDDFPHLLSYLEDGTPCLCEDWNSPQLLDIVLVPQKEIELLVNLQTKNGLYLQNITLEDLREIKWTDVKNIGLLSDSLSEILYSIRPKTFHEFTTIVAHTKNKHRAEQIPTPEFYHEDYSGSYRLTKSCVHSPFTREDWQEAIGHYESDPYVCFLISEGIRKGIYYRYQKTGDRQPNHYSSFEQLPDQLQELANQYQYVCARSMAISHSLMYMMFAYYLKTNAKVYSKLVFKQVKEF